MMVKDERLLPLPGSLQLQPQETATTYAPAYEDDPFAEKRSVREYVSVVLKRKWLILTIIIVATSVTALFMYRLPDIYQSETTVLIEPPRPKLSKDTINISLGYDKNYWNTQFKLMQNPELMKAVVIRLGLHRQPTLSPELGGNNIFVIAGNYFTGTKPPEKPQTLPIVADNNTTQNVELSPEEAKRADAYARALGGGLKVEQEELTNLVKLKYESSNPNLAVSISNTIAKVFIENDARLQMQNVYQANDANINSINELQQSIARLEQDRINYLKVNDLPLRGGKENDLVAARLQQYSNQWLNSEEQVRKLRTSLEAALNAKAAGNNIFDVPEINDNPVYQKALEINRLRQAEAEKRLAVIDTEIENLETSYSELLTKYTPEWPEVKRVQKKIADKKTYRERTERDLIAKNEQNLKELGKQAEGTIVTTMRRRLEAAEKQEQQLEAQYFKERAGANELGISEIRLTTMTQELDTNRRLLTDALSRQKELELAMSNSRPDNIKVAAEAQNARLTGPFRPRNISIAFLASLLAGIGLAFLLDYLDDSVKSSDDVSRYLGLPTLALIPHLGSLERATTRGRIGNGKGAPVASNALVALDDARSPIAEAYRHLRTSLLFSSAGKPPQSILITSSQPSEGKTTTAINTAIALAQAGAKVVIVDCDLRRPRLHHHFQMENTHGLTNFLSGERNTDLLLKPVERLPNLQVVTSGPIPPNPAELLGSVEMKNMLDFLTSNYQHVIVDSPPAISFTDAAILATMVDGVVVVAMIGKSSIHLIRRFKQRMKGVGARVYGVVLNGLKRTSLDYNYGYGYSYYYSYSDDSDETTPRMEDETK